MKFFILRAESKDEIKTALVDEDEFATTDNPGDFFVYPFSLNAKKVGEVEIEGDTQELAAVYMEEM